MWLEEDLGQHLDISQLFHCIEYENSPVKQEKLYVVLWK